MKNLSLSIAAIVLTGSLAFGATQISAYEFGQNGFAQGFAERFGLSEEEVSDYMDERHVKMHQVMQENFDDHLNSLVEDGILTQEQKEAWLSKHEEMIADREAERQDHHEEMQTFFEEQGIDHTVLMGFGPHGQRGSRGPMN